ncbi:MAG: hypothetical protein WCJ02_12635 [bacterium]
MKYFTAKAARKSANVTSASPMNTWTAERTFARNQTIFHQQKTSFLLMKMKSDLSGRLSVLPCCIQREADGITALLIAVFALKWSRWEDLDITSSLI